MKVLECKFPNAKWKALVVCGIHGNEHYAIKACWELYKGLRAKESYEMDVTLVFNVNESGIHYCNREWINESNPDNKDFNRAFGESKPSFEEVVKNVKNILINTSWDLILDVHNSLFCAPCALIDYTEKQGGMYQFLKDYKLNPVCLPSSNNGTLKHFAYSTLGVPAVTLECGPMEQIEDDEHLYAKYIKRFLDSFIAHETVSSIKLKESTGIIDPRCTEVPLRTPYEGVIIWNRITPESIQDYYDKGESICRIEKISDKRTDVWEIFAPCNLKIIDIVSSTYVFEGDTLFNYVEV